MRVKVVVLLVACMAANKGFKTKDKTYLLQQKQSWSISLYSEMSRLAVKVGAVQSKSMETECIRNVDLETTTKNQLY